MAGNKRVSQLVELTAAEVQKDDLFLIIDTSARESKKIQAQDVSAYLNASGSILAIHAIMSDTASYLLPGGINWTVPSSSFSIFSPTSLSASYALNAANVISASYAKTSSWAINTINGGGSTLITGSTVPITSSWAINSNLSKSSSFLIYTGVSNGTASYAIVAGNAIISDTASFISAGNIVGTVASASFSQNSTIASFLQYSGIPNGTASYALTAGTTAQVIIDRGVFLADTQSSAYAQIDTIDVLPSSNTSVATDVEAVGTIILPYTSSIPVSEFINLTLKNRNTGEETIVDSTPIYFNMSPTVGNWDSYNSGTIKIPYSLLGTSSLNGSYMLFVTASSSNILLEPTRITRFNLKSLSDVLNVHTDEILDFTYDLPTSIATFSSSAGGPFQDNAFGIRTTGSANIKVIDLSSVGITGIRYIWKCVKLSILNVNNNFLTTIGSLPVTTSIFSCNNNAITSITSLSNTSMSYFDCNQNSLSLLPTLTNTMSYINCSNNPITSLPVTLPFGLTQLYCNSLLITTEPLAFPNSIVSMSFATCSNLTTWITPLPTSLVSFNCGYSPIGSLPTIPSQVLFLTATSCSFNNIAMENITNDLVNNGSSSGYLNILGNGNPDPTALTNIFTLLGRSWTVLYDI